MVSHRMELFTNIATCSSIVYMAYPIVSYLLATTIPTFKHSKRKNYIVKNVLKAMVLPVLLVYATMTILLKEEWDNATVRRVASAYVANDFIALLMCRLPLSTRTHHTASCLFLVYAHTIDFNDNRDAVLLFYYTLFSAAAFPVNMYLGLRHCVDNLDKLRIVSKYIYIISLAMNWTTQIIMGMGSWGYTLLLLCIVYDDVVLLKWLSKQHSRKKLRS